MPGRYSLSAFRGVSLPKPGAVPLADMEPVDLAGRYEDRLRRARSSWGLATRTFDPQMRATG
jgi:hypothetical protein